jgi:hypothetical protein
MTEINHFGIKGMKWKHHKGTQKDKPFIKSTWGGLTEMQLDL